MTGLMGRKFRNDYSLWPVTALTPLRIAGKCHWYVSPRITFLSHCEQEKFLDQERGFTALQLPVAAYICRLCVWGFVPEQERETRSQFSTYEIIIQRFRETRAPCHGLFSTLQKQGSSGLGSGPQTGGVYQESTFLFLYPCFSCFSSDHKTDHGDVSCAFMVPDSQSRAWLSTPSRALFCGSP